MVFHEHIDYNACVDILTSLALGSVIAKFKTFKDVGFDIFNKLYNSMVVPITDYCSSVWGYGIFTKAASIPNRAICYFLGVHSKAPLAGLQREVNWITPRYGRHLCKIRFWNRLTRMDHTRLTKKIALWDKSICVKKLSSDMKSILLSINKLNEFKTLDAFNINVASNLLTQKMNEKWKTDILSKPKLRTYVTFKSVLQTE